MLIGWLTIAERGTRHDPTSSVVAWVGVLIAVALVGGIAAIILRRKFLADEASASPASLMDELREQLKRAEITPAEFDAAKRLVVARATGTSPRAAPNSTASLDATAPGEREGVVRARPGFDLTGERLPGPASDPPKG